METLVILLLTGLLAVALIFIIKNKNQINKTYQEIEKEIYKKENKEIKNLIKEKEQKIQELNNINKEITEKQNFNFSLLKIREDELDRIIDEKRIQKEDQLEREITQWAISAQKAASEYFVDTNTQNRANSMKIKDEVDFLENEVAYLRGIRDAANQEILRRRAIEEKEEFYKINLDEASKHDIELLSSIRPSLHKIELLDKTIYDIYIKKPTEEMIKRILKGEAPSGIYKITRLKTGEIYIGKSTNIKNRWLQHTKSVFHCGTISHSMLHTTMEKDGIENFTWELLEVVPKEKLGEREAYWIDFYDSKKFGLNMREGG